MTEAASRAGGQRSPIPVTVVSGFLGAGKTTLLNHVLTAEHGRRIGVLVNDFGSINVDAELIADVDDDMISLANGCICCSIRMDLIRAVLQMAELPEPPEHIVIESSGVANPAGIVKSFLEPDIWATVRLDGVIIVVDAEQTLGLPAEEARLARTQVAGGDLIALNKADLVDAATLGEVREWIDAVRPGIQVFETSHCRLPVEILLGVNATTTEHRAFTAGPGVHVQEVDRGVEARSHDHGADHDIGFDTWTYTAETPLSMAWLHEIITHLPSTVFRMKGFVHTVEEPGRRTVVQLVGRRATITQSSAWGAEEPRTRLVFISRSDTVNYAAIEQALDRSQV
jgi:G3E family GTPase